MKKLFLLSVLFFLWVSVYAQSSACRLLKNVPRSLKVIKDSAAQLFHAHDDDCIVQLIDSLKDRFIKTHKTEYLVCLDSICWNCNDAVGERFIDTTLFFKSFKPYVDYLYHNGDTINCLELNLEEGFDFDEMEDPNDVQDAKKRLEGFISAQEKLYPFADEEKKFIELIKNRAENLKMDDEE